MSSKMNLLRAKQLRRSFTNEKSWQIAGNLASQIKEFPKARWAWGDLFDPATGWQPGCKVCALGAVAEVYIPDNVLVTLPNKIGPVVDLVLPKYVEQFGPVNAKDFNVAVSLLIEVNDSLRLPFAEAYEAIEGVVHAENYAR